MSRKKPNIGTQYPSNTDEINSFTLTTITDSFIRDFIPGQLTLSEPDQFFVLYMQNKRLLIDYLGLPDYSDYVDIYLNGRQQFNNTYTVTSDGIDITIQFNQSIVENPLTVANTEFIVRANICEVPH